MVFAEHKKMKLIVFSRCFSARGGAVMALALSFAFVGGLTVAALLLVLVLLRIECDSRSPPSS
jgi:hypothetical protein